MTPRPDPPPQPDERTALESFLDYFRATLLWKAEGLTDDQARTASVEPSIMSIAGLLRHMAEVERHWFQMYLRGDVEDRLFWSQGPDADMLMSDDTTLAECTATFRREVEISRSIAAQHALDDLSVKDRHGARLPRLAAEPSMDHGAHDRGVRPSLWSRRPHPRAHRRRHRRLTALSRAGRPAVAGADR